MARETNSAAVAARSADCVDDLFNYEVGLDDILQETNPSMSSGNVPKQSAQPNNSGVFLGLDEEVEVAKKRQPVAKLDENRLLTQAGIPKLRRSAKKTLKFKGKGHEFSDLARLLNFYQLWLDDLFPRAKFTDGLAMIERLGHSKRLQTMRRAWIDEEKPKSAVENTLRIEQTNSNDNDITSNDTLMVDHRQSIPNDISRSPGDLNDMDEALFLPDSTTHQQSAGKDRAPLDNNDEFDELDALLREHRDEPDIRNLTSTGSTSNGHCSPADDDFAELDALLREHEDEHDIGNLNMEELNGPTETDSHADELEAMEGIGMSGLMK
ncbi:replication fork protection component Swi3-domain-containing protein [Aspergillus spinulosporus]